MTKKILQELRHNIMNDLAMNPRDCGDIPGLSVGFMDTGCSAICQKKMRDIVSGTFESLENPLDLGGIAGGLKVLGRGKTKFEFVTSDGNTICLTRDCYYVPDLAIDLIPPQKIMRDASDGWFKINGHAARLEFRDGSVVSVPFDPVTSLPMLYSFDSVEKAAEQMEMG